MEETLSHRDLEDIYELTYKYQMLKQEAALGDYGLPTQLPDQAYIALERIKQDLSTKFSEALPIMQEVFSGWLEHHVEQAGQELFEGLWAEIQHSIRSATSYAELQNIFNEDELREAFVGVDSRLEEYSTVQEMIDYTETLGPVEESALFKGIKTYLAEHPELNEIVEERVAEQQEDYHSESAIAGVQDSLDDIEYAMGADLDFQIEAFQKALTTAHNNGSMAEYLLSDPYAARFLSELSAGPHVDEWNAELSKLLGYPLGSRSAPTQEWYTMSHLRRAMLMLASLTQRPASLALS